MSERLMKLSRWLRRCRAISEMPSEAAEAYAGIVEAFDESDIRPETVADELDALRARVEELERENRALKEEAYGED
jgi:cell division protein FtsB